MPVRQWRQLAVGGFFSGSPVARKLLEPCPPDWVATNGNQWQRFPHPSRARKPVAGPVSGGSLVNCLFRSKRQRLPPAPERFTSESGSPPLLQQLLSLSLSLSLPPALLFFYCTCCFSLLKTRLLTFSFFCRCRHPLLQSYISFHLGLVVCSSVNI